MGKKQEEQKKRKQEKIARAVNRCDVLCSELGLPAHIKVNDMQLKFCLLYLQTLDLTGSYFEVFNCSYESAKNQASVLINKPYIKECISWLIDQSKEGLDITVGEVMSEIKSIALDKSITPSTRLKALQLLADIKGMRNDNVEVNVAPVINVSIVDDDNNEVVDVVDVSFDDVDE